MKESGGELVNECGREHRQGLVIAVRPRAVVVRMQGGDFACPVPRRLRRGTRVQRAPLAVGDRVILEIDARGNAMPVELLPRRTKISRLGSLRPLTEHVIAANMDQLLALQAVDQPPFNAGALDRLLLLGEAGGARCAIGLNKIDLASPGEAERLLEPYRATGYPIFLVSALTEEGLAEVGEFLGGHETAIIGLSGVGKSTLLNRLLPDAALSTAAVSRSTRRGVHTTTRVDYLDLPGGGAVLDTPGLRTIQPWGLPLDRLASLYPEFRPHLGACRFGDCLHSGEPGCAVEDAARRGEIPAARHQGYKRILEGLRFEGRLVHPEPESK